MRSLISIFPDFGFPPVAGIHKFILCLYRFVKSSHFTYIESWNAWSFACGFFSLNTVFSEFIPIVTHGGSVVVCQSMQETWA